jgi:hypothetical protein
MLNKGAVVGGIAIRIISLPDRTYDVFCIRRQTVINIDGMGDDVLMK